MLKLLILTLFFFIYQILLTKSKNLMISNLNDINDENDCPENCLDNKCDNITKKCDSCKDGFYKDECDEICPRLYCIKCEQENGECTQCDSTHLLIENYCCENICNKCNDDGCTECKSLDKYGNKCENCPDNCKYDEGTRKCDQISGECFSCILGKKGNVCNENCNEGCDLEQENCNQYDGKCTCKEGYYGDTCEAKCDENCEECDKVNGTCYKCKEGYYAKDKECIICPINCDGKCPGGICVKCKDSFYGDICDKNCSPKCVNNKCRRKDGYCSCINHYDKYSKCFKCEINYDIDTDCTECINHYNVSTNCTNCLNNYDIDELCNKCKSNYDINSDCLNCINHYDIKQDCQKCESNYREDTNCTKCLDNYNSSNNCETCINHYTLSSNCQECEEHYTSSSYCQECEENYDFSENCQKCKKNFDIDTNCQNCILGYYGKSCNFECFDGCDTSISNCDRETGKCENCIIGYYDEYCKSKCNEHCSKESYICDKNTGKCINCENKYYGDFCEKKVNIENCLIADRENGTCIKCENSFYLTNKNKCQKCPSDCENNMCEDRSGKCIQCSDFDSFGDICDLKCSKFCNKKEGNYTCDRYSGECLYGCLSSGNFSDIQCTQCTGGYYPQDEGCNLECSDNCENKFSCSQINGGCTCKKGFWEVNCTRTCDINCKRGDCAQGTGECNECVDGFYKNEKQKCVSCPVNCNTCTGINKCTSCKDGKYGKENCEKSCSSHCDGKSCELDGSCNCENKYYGETCDSMCEGCSDNGCEDKTGKCLDHFCLDNYYDARMCNKKCSEKCEGKKCDIFTGECISCPNDKWGEYCNKTCHPDCKDDGRLDCCYIKDHDKKPLQGFQVDISYQTSNNYELKEEQNEFGFIDIKLGEFKLKILVDFETNSPLVIFDEYTQITPIETEIYTIKINKTYKSLESQTCILGDSIDGYYEYDGFFLTKERKAEDTLEIGDKIFKNFSFLICQEYKIDRDFDNAGQIDGIVGLGLRNYFTENLFYNNEGINFPKNILIRNIDTNSKKTVSIYFGDYQYDIIKSFSKLSTMIIENKKDIVMDKLINFETKFTGIAYSLRKAYQYQYDKKVILNNREETTIVFNNLYKQFFEKIYFGDLFENGCYFKNLQVGEVEYYCDKNKKQQIQTLPKLGLILGDYIYYLSHNFLYKESEDYFTFLIKLHGQGQQKIVLGKSFFNEFSIVYNNGNETLNFFGDVKKLNVPLKDPTNLLNIDSDIFTPGGWVTLIVFITVLIIIFCYLIKYCGEKTDNEDEDDDIDYEEDSLIDDTLE